MAFSRTEAVNYLRRSHELGRLGHAYLITGRPGSGKRALAAELAHELNGVATEQVFSPSATGVFVAEPESKSRRIVIEQVRGLEHFLQRRAAEGRRKVAIIVDADRLQPQAANAFLKTLEEPPRDSLLLLLTTLPEVLPDTILSRCIAVPLEPEEARAFTAEEEALVELLRTTADATSPGIQNAYRLAQGFQRLLAQMKGKVQDQFAAALKADEARYKNTTDGAWLENREDHYKALSEAAYIEQRGRLLEVLFAWWTDVLRASNGVARRELRSAQSESEAVAKRLETPEILRRLRRLEELRDHLSRNVQEALALETAFLRVFT